MRKQKATAVEQPNGGAQPRRSTASPQAVGAAGVTFEAGTGQSGINAPDVGPVRWEITHERASGRGPRPAQNWTGVCLRAWRDSLTAAGFASATVEKYASAVHCYFEWAVVADVNHLTEPRVIEQWFDMLASRSVGTARTYWTAMKAFWRWAHDNSWINADPMSTVLRPAPPPPRFEDILEARGLAAVATAAHVPTRIRRRNVWYLDQERGSSETFKAASA